MLTTIEQALIADKWHKSRSRLLQFLARQKNDLDEYSKKPDANPKAIEIRTQGISIIAEFLEASDEIIDEQKNELLANNAIQSKHRLLLDEHKILRKYAEQKGCDLTLLPYLTLKDF